jgi:uncharacterized protein
LTQLFYPDNIIQLIEKYYRDHPKALRVITDHGQRVADKALAVADAVKHLKPDLEFIAEAALLHDIGMLFTDSPKLGCFGNHPYVCHGILGRVLLEKEGYPRHALVCERHVGVGISAEDVVEQKLPVPVRDMRPQSVEEQIICYADKFYSKNGGASEEKTTAEILNTLQRYGADKVQRFKAWMALFEPHRRSVA